MGALKVSDNAATTLAGSLTDSPLVTSMTLADASKFPVVNHGGSGTDWSYATLFDSANNLEVVKVTRRDNASNTLTIVRGSAAGITGVTDGSCLAWASGTTGVACRLIAQTVNDLYANNVAAAASASAAAASAAAAATDAADAEAAAATAVAKTGGLFTKGAGAEGGQVDFEKPDTGTVLTDNVSVDVYGSMLRVFSTVGGVARAALLEFNKLPDGNSKVITFPSGTRLPFAQATAPVGWTQDVSDNADNRMLRVVKTAGAGVGGSHSPILNNVVPAHTHGFTTGNANSDHSHSGNTGTVSQDHTHGIGDPGHSHNQLAGLVGSGGSYYADVSGGYQSSFNTQSATTGIWAAGMSANHYHGFTTGGFSANHQHGGSTDNGSSQTNWTPRYTDLIICTKD